MSTTSSIDKTTSLVSLIQEILLSEPAGLTSRDIAHRLVLVQAPYSSSSSSTFIKRVQRILSMYNVAAKNSRGGCFRFSHDNNVWQLSQGQYNHYRPSSHHPKKLPSFQLSRNTSQTTTTQTPTPSTSSLSIISSRVGSSLTTGIMEQVSTWRTGADTDDDDEASLEIYSNPPLNRGSYPSQESRESSNLSGGSLLNGMEILPTLHQLQFPQHPLEHSDDQDLYHTHPNQQYSNIMPPPSSTVSSFRRHSVSSHRDRASSSRPNRQSLDESGGDQFVPGSNRPNFHSTTVEILARGIRQLESTSKGGMAAASDREQGNNNHSNNHSNNSSGFPSPRTTVPSPGIQPIPAFVQPPHQGSSRGDSDSHNRQSSGQGRPLSSPNHNESPHQRNHSRSFGDVDDLLDEDEPMLRPEPVRPKFKHPSRTVKEDPRLRDLGASLQKSLSFNGGDEYQSILDEEELRDHRQSSLQPPRGRHHPYLPRPFRDESSGQRGGPSGQTRGQIEANFRRKGKARAFDPHDDDLQLVSKTPVLLSAINASQTNILSELQNVQRQNERDLVHFRNELYGSLQVAFSTLADQVGSVGKAVTDSETKQMESIQQLGTTIGSAMGEIFAKMTETFQQNQLQQPYMRYQQPPPIRQTSPFVGQSLQNTLSGPFSHAFSTAGSVSGGQSSNWRRNDYTIAREEEEGDEDDDHGRGKRRAVERPLSSSGNRRTVNRPRQEFDEKH
ncbi:hypothetical protein BGZ93_011157 [Podila epicladia]|nr:hypothetical protein BGZ93_011157 [Podila epicladia]